MKTYKQKYYDITMTEHPDNLTVHKSSDSDWFQISMTTNGDSNGTILIRSQTMAEALRFMLEQILRTFEGD